MNWKRGGSTATKWNASGPIAKSFAQNGHVCLRFSMSAAGGGRTEVEIDIAPNEFSDLLSVMKQADPQALIAGLLGLGQTVRSAHAMLAYAAPPTATTILAPIAGAPPGAPIPPFPS